MPEPTLLLRSVYFPCAVWLPLFRLGRLFVCRYSVELATQRVWDYSGEGYVHRLVQNLSDGKPIEFHSTSLHTDRADMAQSAVGSAALSLASAGTRSVIPPDTDVTLARARQKKAGALRREYNALLASQLDTQRQYYEKLLVRVVLRGT